MAQLDVVACRNAEKWLESSIEESIKQEIRSMKESNVEEFNDAFYKTLEFGTGGLRGIMGIGTNRMNIYTVSMTTQGFCDYIKEQNPGKEIKTVISHDCRNNSKDFALITARVMAANGFKVFLFEDLRPTPELSFAVRELCADAGVMITASHNPKEYNGYKAYWNDGAQLTAPHDVLVIEKVNAITDIAQVKIQNDNSNITFIGEDMDNKYLQMVHSLSMNRNVSAGNKNLKIVYTPLHGTGIMLVPKALRMYGFNSVHLVEAQSICDGNFHTCVSPNPEEPAALDMGLKLAKQINADMLLATDPDADRVATAVRNKRNEWIPINGNQMVSLLTYYLLERRKEQNMLKQNDFVINTVVTTDLVKEIAKSFDVKCYSVLTGFKHIAAKIRNLQGKEKYIGGGEESYGYLIGDSVRDKDSVSACCILAEMAEWASKKSWTLYELLLDIYMKYGFYHEEQVSIVRKGKSGAAQIKQMMSDFRNNPPEKIDGTRVADIIDYLNTDVTHLPESNVLQYLLEDGCKVSVRPSGTEPKIKFYFSVRLECDAQSDFQSLKTKALEKIDRIKREMNL